MRYVVFNRKGGVGKSTLVCNLAAVAASQGQRTLVVDLDPQANATHYLLGAEAREGPGLAGFFEETVGFKLLSSAPEHWVRETAFPNLSILAGDESLADLQVKLESRYKIFKLRDLLAKLREFDRIYLDTPPAVGFFTLSALIAAQRCIIPFDCDEFSRRALYQLMGTVRETREDHNAELEVAGVVVNQFQPRARLPQRLVEELRQEGLPVLEPYLHSSVKVRESHQAHRPLPFLAPKHKLSQQIGELYLTLESQLASESSTTE